MVKVRIALVAIALCVPAAAYAVPITIDFNVTTTMSQFGGAITPGYQAGVVGSGYFTFDDSIRDVPAVVGGISALDLSVSWLGQSWDVTTARIGSLSYNLDGSLRGWLIGGWSAGDCGIGCVPNIGRADFWVGTDYGVFSSYIHVPQSNGGIYASTSWSVRSVPEPDMAALMGVGLLGAWLARRRGKKLKDIEA